MKYETKNVKFAVKVVLAIFVTLALVTAGVFVVRKNMGSANDSTEHVSTQIAELENTNQLKDIATQTDSNFFNVDSLKENANEQNDLDSFDSVISNQRDTQIDYGSASPLTDPSAQVPTYTTFRTNLGNVKAYNQITELKFNYMDPASGYTETSYYVDTTNSRGKIWVNNSDSTKLVAVCAGGFTAPASCADLFSNLSALTTLDLTALDTSSVTHMSYMFSGCSVLSSLDVSNFNTSSVTNMYGMFVNCSSLTSLNLSNFDTAKIMYQSTVFGDLKSAMSQMFSGCSSLTSLDISSFTVGSSYSISGMLYGCTSLQTLKAPASWSASAYTLPFTMYDLATSTAYTELSSSTNGKTLVAELPAVVPVYTTLRTNVNNVCTYTSITEFKFLTTAPASGYTETIYYLDATNSRGKIWVNSSDSTKLVAVCAGGFTAPASCASLFSGWSALTTLDLTALDTSSVTDMSGMFHYCRALSSLNLSGWDTSTVTNMSQMFYCCYRLSSLNLSGWDTSSVTNMSYMFYCEYMGGDFCVRSVLDMSGWDTSSVTDMSYMFYGNLCLSSLNLSNFDTSSVTNMSKIFEGCESLGSLNLSGWDTSSVTDMHGMFCECDELSGLNLSGWNTSSVTNMSSMFENCCELGGLNLSGWDTSSVTDMSYMFSGCSVLSSLDLSGWDTSSVTDMSCMFSGCSGLTSLDVSNFDTSSVTNMSGMFSGCSVLSSLDISMFSVVSGATTADFITGCTALETLKTPTSWLASAYTLPFTMYDSVGGTAYTTLGSSNVGKILVSTLPSVNLPTTWKTDLTNAGLTLASITAFGFYYTIPSGYGSSIGTINSSINIHTNGTAVALVAGGGIIAPANMDNAFNGWTALTSINFTALDTSNVARMRYFFNACRNLTTITWGTNFSTANVTTMTGVFSGCYRLSSLDLSGWDTSRVTDISEMFYCCNALSSLNISGWDTSSVTTITTMFYGCVVLSSLDLSGWDTSSVKDMTTMFLSCSALTSLDLSGWDTSSATTMPRMFYRCYALSSLDLSGWDTSSVTTMYCMFYGCSSLTSLDVSDFDTSKVTNMSGMFYGCSGLTSLDVSNFDTANATTLRGMFGGCSGLTSLNLSNFNTAKNTSTWAMFYGCSVLTSITFGANFDTSKVTTFESMFDRTAIGIVDISMFSSASATTLQEMFNACTNLTSVTFPASFTASSATNITLMFNGCSALTTVDISAFTVNANATSTNMFTGCTALQTLKTPTSWLASAYTLPFTMYDRVTGTAYTQLSSATNGLILIRTVPSAVNLPTTWKADMESAGLTLAEITEIHFLRVSDGYPTTVGSTGEVSIFRNGNAVALVALGGIVAPADMSSAFDSWSALTTADFFALNTSNVTNMSYFFNECGNLTTINWGNNFSTANVTDMSYIFRNCFKLTTLNLSHFNTSKVTTMSRMISGYGADMALTSVNISSFTSEALTDVSTLFQRCANLTTIVFPTAFTCANVTNMSYMFNNCSRLTSLDVTNFNTGNVTNMQQLFCNCSSLISLNLSNFNTANVTNMQSMFNGCSGLTSLDVSNFNTANVTNMQSMFNGCSGLTSLDVSNFNTANVTTMQNMFAICTSLASLDLSHFNTAKNTSTWAMFYGCSVLTSITFGANFDTSKVTTFESMFDGTAIGIVDISMFSSASATTLQEMFNACTNLTSVTFPASFTTLNATNISKMFKGCTSLKTLDLSNFNTAKVTTMASLFQGCTLLNAVKMNNFTIGSSCVVTDMFTGCNGMGVIYAPKSIASGVSVQLPIDMYDEANTLTSTMTSAHINQILTRVNATLSSIWQNSIPKNMVTELRFLSIMPDGYTIQSKVGDINVCNNGTKYALVYPGYITATADCTNFLQGFSALQLVDFEMLDTRYMTNMSYYFSGDRNLQTVLFGKRYVTSAVTNMSYMFNSFGSLNFAFDTNTSDGISDFRSLDYSHVTNMSHMFTYAYMNEIDLSSIDTSSVTDMSYMFAYTYGYGPAGTGLTSLTLGADFDTSKVINMSYMFYSCGLTSLDLSMFDTSNVMTMASMLGGNSRLGSLNISSFDSTDLDNTSSMFSGCSGLTSLTMGVNFTCASVTNMSGMFSDCTGLQTLNINSMVLNVADSKMLDGDNSLLTVVTPVSIANGLSISLPYFMKVQNTNDSTMTITKTYENKTLVKDTSAMQLLKTFKNDLSLAGITTNQITDLSIVNSAPSGYTKTAYKSGNLDIYTNTNTKVALVATDAISLPSDCTSLFSNLTDLVNLDLSGIDASTALILTGLFGGDSNLTTVILPDDLNTENVESMYGMIQYGSYAKTSWDFGALDTSNVTDFSFMFRSSNVESLTFEGWDTSKVTTFQNMFSNCTHITKLNLSDFVIGANVNTTDMFKGMSALLEIRTPKSVSTTISLPFTMYDLNTGATKTAITTADANHTFVKNLPAELPIYSTFETKINAVANYSTVTSLKFCLTAPSGYTDSGCYADSNNLAKIYTSNTNAKDLAIVCPSGVSLPANSGLMFAGWSALISIDFTNCYFDKVTNLNSFLQDDGNLTSVIFPDDINTSNVTNMSGMFNWCASLTSLDVSNFNTGAVTDMSYMFSGCSGLTSLDVSNFNTGAVTSMSYMFSGCSGLTSLDITDFDTSAVTDMSYMFTWCSSLTSLDVSNFDTSEVTDMSGMFDGCSSLTSLDVSNFNTGAVTHMVNMFSGCSSLTSLYVSNFNTGAVEDMYCMFAGCTSLTTLNLSSFDTSEVTDMSGMFSGCSGLTSLDVSNFDTSEVADMPAMFYGCSGLATLDLSSFDSSAVGNMSSMFEGCIRLETLNLSTFDTSEVTYMSNMFSGCSGLATLDLSSFDTSAVEDMSRMFEGCTRLETLNLSTFDTSEVTDMSWMFSGCSGLTSLEVSDFDTSEVMYMSGMFSGCSGLTSLDVSDFDMINVFDVTGMFTGMSSLVELKTASTIPSVLSATLPRVLYDSITGDRYTTMSIACQGRTLVNRTVLQSGWKTDLATAGISSPTELHFVTSAPSGYVTTNCYSGGIEIFVKDSTKVAMVAPVVIYAPEDSSELFSNLTAATIELTNFNTSNVTDMSCMFTDCRVLSNITFGNNFDTSNVVYMHGMFEDCFGLNTLNLSAFDTSEVENMKAMFARCDTLTILTFGSGFNTANTKCMGRMFEGCTGLMTLDLSAFDTSAVEDMYRMFAGCTSLTTLDLSSFDTSAVENMSSMFEGCTRLKTLNLSTFDTSEVTDMSNMFSGCSGLATLDLSSFDTSAVEDLSSMFEGCTRLETLNLSTFDTSEVTDMSNMFSGCSDLISLDISSLNMGAVTNATSMFDSMSALTQLTTPATISSSVNATFTNTLYDLTTGTGYSALTSACANKTLVRPMFTITLDARGGNCEKSAIYLTTNLAIGAMPNATRNAYIFLGWFSASEGGSQILESQTFNADTTIYAHWQAKTIDFTAVGYTGVYDGNAHGITVTPGSSGVTITYSNAQNGTYSSTDITRTDVGTTTVYFKLSKDGYVDTYGNATVTISQANGYVTLLYPSLDCHIGESISNTVKSSHGGALRVSAPAGVTATISGTTITLTSAQMMSLATVTVTCAAYGNYKQASTTFTVSFYAEFTVEINNAVTEDADGNVNVCLVKTPSNTSGTDAVALGTKVGNKITYTLPCNTSGILVSLSANSIRASGTNYQILKVSLGNNTYSSTNGGNVTLNNIEVTEDVKVTVNYITAKKVEMGVVDGEVVKIENQSNVIKENSGSETNVIVGDGDSFKFKVNMSGKSDDYIFLGFRYLDDEGVEHYLSHSDLGSVGGLKNTASESGEFTYQVTADGQVLRVEPILREKITLDIGTSELAALKSAGVTTFKLKGDFTLQYIVEGLTSMTLSAGTWQIVPNSANELDTLETFFKAVGLTVTTSGDRKTFVLSSGSNSTEVLMNLNGSDVGRIAFTPGITIANFQALVMANNSYNSTLSYANTCGWFYNSACTQYAYDSDVLTESITLYTKSATLAKLYLFTDTLDDETVVFVGGHGGGYGDYVIPRLYNNMPVKIIMNSGFSYSKLVTSVIMPATISVVRSYGLGIVNSSFNIVLPEGVKCISLASFSGCNVNTIILPSSLTALDIEFMGYKSTVSRIEFCGTMAQLATLSNIANDFMYHGIYSNYYSIICTDGTFCYTVVGGTCCFEAGTQITMADGTTKNIEDVEVGDKTLSYSLSKGEFIRTTVTSTIIKQKTYDMATVIFDDGTCVRMNAYHPLYTENDYHSLTKYKGCDMLAVGDKVMTENGWKTIVSIDRELLDNPMVTYNLVVANNNYSDVNNYFANGSLAQSSNGTNQYAAEPC